MSQLIKGSHIKLRIALKIINTLEEGFWRLKIDMQ